jgi:arylsulfatase A-like enzyme
VPGGNPGALKSYYAAITSLDDCLGRIMKALADAGVADDTILCFSSDHGDMFGSQGQSMKQRPWEESINIPFILRFPEKVKAGQRRDWIVSSVDVMPTLLGLSDIAIPANVQKMNLASLFRGKPSQERDAAFLFNQNAGTGPGTDWRGIRTKDWIYAFHAHGDWVMYDLKHDPYELKNLVGDPAYKERRDQLAAQLSAIRKQWGEHIPLTGKLLTGPAAAQVGSE